MPVGADRDVDIALGELARNRHLTREEGVALVHKFDGEFPERYFREVMEYIGMKPERFHELCDEFSELLFGRGGVVAEDG